MFYQHLIILVKMDRRLRPIILFFVINIITNVIADNPVVELSLGTIRGVQSEDGDVNMFMGIPYGTVNESNPFGAAIPHPGFDIVFEANDDSSKCPQIEEFEYTFVGDIDCLHLNVYTPSWANANSRLPVFFWIYGGGFAIGFNGRFLYGPKFLVRHDIILVTINYRLGPYGFMCLDIPEIPGNQGLKDTLMALRWVQEHIEAFGGDPDNVTIGGNSAGGMISDYHMIRQPNGETLFNKAILQSGTAMYSMSDPDRNYPLTMASHLNYVTDDIYDAIAYLTTVPPRDLIEAASVLRDTGPCIEKKFEGIESFLSERITTSLHHIENVSIMTGITDDELYSLHATPGLNDSGIVDNYLDGWSGVHDVRNFYFGDNDLDTLRGAIDFLSDLLFVYPVTHQSIRKLLEDNAKSVHFYMFAHDGGRNFVKYRENIVGGGAVHADELGYLFDMELITEEPSQEDQFVIDKMTTMWANFVKYGNPTPQTTQLLDVMWEPVTKTSPLYCMVIAPELSLVSRPFNDRMTFIDLLYEVNEDILTMATEQGKVLKEFYKYHSMKLGLDLLRVDV